MSHLHLWMLSVCLCLAASVWADEPAPEPPRLMPIDTMDIEGAIDGRNIAFTLRFDLDEKNTTTAWPLLRGDAVLESIDTTGKPRIEYLDDAATYQLRFAEPGRHHVEATFAVRPTVLQDKPLTGWHEARFTVPASRVRQLRIVCDRTDLEVRFVDALRQRRQVVDGKLIVTAVLGPGKPFVVRWKPQVQAMDAELMLSARLNTIARLTPAALRLDTLYHFAIAQGRLTELRFDVPASLSITQVRGQSIRDWRLSDAANNRQLIVQLSQPQAESYDMRIVAERMLDAFPATLTVPTIQPAGEVRASGHLAIGTDSAIEMIVQQTAGLSQIDAAAFPRDALTDQPRPLPTSHAFYYSFASGAYQLDLSLDDIVPAYDAAYRLTAEVREDDLIVDTQLELDVRDAPLRRIDLDLPAGWVLASVTGPAVDDYRAPANADDPLTVHFKEPVIGRTVIALRLELGRTPLDQPHTLGAPIVRGATSQRGYVVVAAEPGIQLDRPEATDLREVHTGSIPMRNVDAQFAYRFREATWSLTLAARAKTPAIRAETFELVTLGDRVAHGSIAVNYFIAGAPIDTLQFSAGEGLDNIEFVGRDVRRWTRDGDTFTVTLSRKVVGDYNLAVSYRQRYEDAGAIHVGRIEPMNTQTQTGFITLASHLNLQLEEAGEPDGLLEIARDEVPANYRLLISAPILKTYKFIRSPHQASLTVRAYERGELLPVVIELMQIDTDIAIDDASHTESVTRIRYKIKNTSAQFLPLTMPAGANVWSTHRVELSPDGSETRHRINASFDSTTGELLIPLKRPRNPNDPITIDLEYGQSHSTLGAAGQLNLTAPQSPTRSTFANWTVTAPQRWAVHPAAGSNMLAGDRTAQLGDLSRLLGHVRDAWASAIGRIGRDMTWLFVAVGIAGVLVLVGVLQRAALGEAGLIIGIGAVVVLGAMAANTSGFLTGLNTADDLRTVQFTQPLNLGDGQSPTLATALTPAWRQHATWTGAVVIPMAALACVAIGLVWRRSRSVLLAVGLSGLIYAAAQFDVITTDTLRLPVSLMLGHLMTWGLPVVLAMYLLWRCAASWMSRAVKPAAATAAVALAVLFGHADDTAAMEAKRPMDINIIQRVDATLTAERDSMQIEYDATFAVTQPKRFRLLSADAVLLSDDEPAEHVKLTVDGEHHYIELGRAGRYDLTLKFVAPLAGADDAGVRRFTAPLPPALTNRVELRIPQTGLVVDSLTAVRFDQREADGQTIATAIVGPRDPMAFTWKPRLRQTKLEQTVFYAETISLLRFDAALAAGVHDVQLQIAQGELDAITIEMPQAMNVTAVSGEHVGAWRFDPATSRLEVKLTEPVSGGYGLRVASSVGGKSLPWEATVGGPRVVGAEHQRGSIGLVSRPAVYLTIDKHPPTMNTDDFTRTAAALMKSLGEASAPELRYAYRLSDAADRVTLSVHEVLAELRASQASSFSINDQRLAFNADLRVQIAKAGVFTVTLELPAGYDIDALDAGPISHWDETTEGEKRRVQVHFKQKLRGEVAMKLALSKPVGQLPPTIDVPRVRLAGAVKHTGQITVTAARGTRLSVDQRTGVSELNPMEVGLRESGALVFKLLRPDWVLTLNAEVVEPRITVDYLHVAQVSEGLVRHNHYLRYHLAHAGAKVFEIVVPEAALGVQITGPQIANMEPVEGEAGRWRIELARKWFDRAYPLSVRYETRFDMTAGSVAIEPLVAEGGDLYRGHIAVRTSDKVELRSQQVGPNLSAAESRTIDARFGAGDLSDAVFTYACPGDRYTLRLAAQRHDAAKLLEADVHATKITTVVNERGQSINRVALDLQVGAKRHLAARLPDGATIWSLTVNRRATPPSVTTDAAGERLVLIPLGHAGAGELPVTVELIYVTAPPKAWRLMAQRYDGPRFDLPLKDVEWIMYLPPGFDYEAFAGTLSVDQQTLRNWNVLEYGATAYQQQVAVQAERSNATALALQNKGEQWAQQGQQYKARAALESAYNYSFNDAALNEDARVQLHRLTRQQAMVGLKSRRAHLRPRTGENAPAQQQREVQDLGDAFSQAQADRELAALDRFDSENLQRISDRIISDQQAAAGAVVPLEIHLPARGRVLRFTRPLQVQPDSAMTIRFDAEPITPPQQVSSYAALVGLGVGLCVLLTALPIATRRATAAVREHAQDSPTQ